MITRTHKASGWTRTNLQDGSSRWRITPTDGSGERIVRTLSAHSWQNDANDDRAHIGTDRVVLLDGPALPEWAVAWLTTANATECGRGRTNLRAMVDDADGGF
jgi:hypothetical protein